MMFPTAFGPEKPNSTESTGPKSSHQRYASQPSSPLRVSQLPAVDHSRYCEEMHTRLKWGHTDKGRTEEDAESTAKSITVVVGPDVTNSDWTSPWRQLHEVYIANRAPDLKAVIMWVQNSAKGAWRRTKIHGAIYDHQSSRLCIG